MELRFTVALTLDPDTRTFLEAIVAQLAEKLTALTTGLADAGAASTELAQAVLAVKDRVAALDTPTPADYAALEAATASVAALAKAARDARTVLDAIPAPPAPTPTPPPA